MGKRGKNNPNKVGSRAWKRAQYKKKLEEKNTGKPEVKSPDEASKTRDESRWSPDVAYISYQDLIRARDTGVAKAWNTLTRRGYSFSDMQEILRRGADLESGPFRSFPEFDRRIADNYAKGLFGMAQYIYENMGATPLFVDARTDFGHVGENLELQVRSLLGSLNIGTNPFRTGDRSFALEITIPTVRPPSFVSPRLYVRFKGVPITMSATNDGPGRREYGGEGPQALMFDICDQLSRSEAPYVAGALAVIPAALAHLGEEGIRQERKAAPIREALQKMQSGFYT